jgi:hypothetical protein
MLSAGRCIHTVYINSHVLQDFLEIRGKTLIPVYRNAKVIGSEGLRFGEAPETEQCLAFAAITTQRVIPALVGATGNPSINRLNAGNGARR